MRARGDEHSPAASTLDPLAIRMTTGLKGPHQLDGLGLGIEVTVA
jgi:hypothetical protein